AAHPETPGAGVRALDVEDVLEERQAQLVRRMRRRAGTLVLERGEPIALKGGNDLSDVLAREAQDPRDAGLLPALIEEAHHGPARPVGILELMEAGHGERQLHRDGMAL